MKNNFSLNLKKKKNERGLALTFLPGLPGIDATDKLYIQNSPGSSVFSLFYVKSFKYEKLNCDIPDSCELYVCCCVFM